MEQKLITLEVTEFAISFWSVFKKWNFNIFLRKLVGYN